jgi:hypothetical protein
LAFRFHYFTSISNNNKWIVIDGLQRLCAFRDFVVNKTLKLTGLDFLKQLDGLGFDDLDNIDTGYRRDIEETTISAYLLKAPTPPEAKFNILRELILEG